MNVTTSLPSVDGLFRQCGTVNTSQAHRPPRSVTRMPLLFLFLLPLPNLQAKKVIFCRSHDCINIRCYSYTSCIHFIAQMLVFDTQLILLFCETSDNRYI